MGCGPPRSRFTKPARGDPVSERSRGCVTCVSGEGRDSFSRAAGSWFPADPQVLEAQAKAPSQRVPRTQGAPSPVSRQGNVGRDRAGAGASRQPWPRNPGHVAITVPSLARSETQVPDASELPVARGLCDSDVP